MIVLAIVTGYLLIGIAFSVPFLMKWIHLIDENSNGSSVFFKITILPGVIVLWPILLRKVQNLKNIR